MFWTFAFLHKADTFGVILKNVSWDKLLFKVEKDFSFGRQIRQFTKNLLFFLNQHLSQYDKCYHDL